MDTSEKYIKMCEMAKEIQSRPRSYPGDVWHHEKWGIGIANYHYPKLPSDEGAEKVFWFDGYGSKTVLEVGRPVIVGGTFTWLPRQDQLQEMVKATPKKDNLVPNTGFWAWNKMKTWEQLWLAFIMFKKFHKTWDDEKQEWI